MAVAAATDVRVRPWCYLDGAAATAVRVRPWYYLDGAAHGPRAEGGAHALAHDASAEAWPKGDGQPCALLGALHHSGEHDASHLNVSEGGR